MRIFLIKLFNALLILGVVFTYQSYAMERQKQVDAYKKELAEYEKAKLALEHPYQDGIYEGSGEGYGGKIKVQVTVEGYSIKEVAILSASKETPEYMEAAKTLLDDIVTAQSGDVDAVAGATLSSAGILAGVNKALEKAKNARSLY